MKSSTHYGKATALLALFAALLCTGAVRAELKLCPDGTPSLNLTDPSGHERLDVRLLPTGLPSISFYDQRGSRRATFGMMPFSGNPRAGFFDSGGRAYWQAP